MSRRRDPHTRDLFASPEPVSVGFDPEVIGRGSLASQIARVVSRTTQDAREELGITRRQLAERLTDRLGRSVSETTIEKWASESAEEHRIPLDAFVALIAETKGYEALGFIPSLFGYAVVEEKYVEIIEMKQIEDHKRLLDARMATLQAKARARQ
ncbi:hypothetical protein E3C22_16505 [Jiella endophytica]|uniref:Uncharacterized protein n=1 Tax=Jiella endophytica TaxID=2558362 RepID=A0A4Y8RGC6_9HYPH|nr:hypothetical protein [Jiella endophytica]TFF20510.1 hypothetical protein E3C22_16505 [Jiella endophytica]